MGWVSRLAGTVVSLGTSPFIYFIERHPNYIGILQPFFEALDRGEFRAITSTLTLTEVLVHPIRNRNASLAAQYARILSSARNLAVLPVSDRIATEAAELRALHGLRTPDAIQLATARIGGAGSFLTNDMNLKPPAGMNLLVLNTLLATP